MKLTKDDVLVCVLVDGLRNYMTKHLNKDWMIEKCLMPLSNYDEVDNQFNNMTLNDLNL